MPGEIDYRLARRQRISAFRKGRLGRPDVCDAHPELIRAARNVGQATAEACPICEAANLVHVSYVFGPRMPPSGRCVTSKSELRRLSQTGAELVCYVVEVCPACCWNHLCRGYVVSPPRARRRSVPSA